MTARDGRSGSIPQSDHRNRAELRRTRRNPIRLRGGRIYSNGVPRRVWDKRMGIIDPSVLGTDQSGISVPIHHVGVAAPKAETVHSRSAALQGTYFRPLTAAFFRTDCLASRAPPRAPRGACAPNSWASDHAPTHVSPVPPVQDPPARMRCSLRPVPLHGFASTAIRSVACGSVRLRLQDIALPVKARASRAGHLRVRLGRRRPVSSNGSPGPSRRRLIETIARCLHPGCRNIAAILLTRRQVLTGFQRDGTRGNSASSRPCNHGAKRWPPTALALKRRVG